MTQRKKGMKERGKKLENLRKVLQQLTEFIYEAEECPPEFYRFLDAMKNNIDIFFYVGNLGDEEDTQYLVGVLKRDWNAAHGSETGVQNYDYGKEHPGADPGKSVYFAGMIAAVANFFAASM